MVVVPEPTRIDFLAFRLYEALAKDINPFFKKSIKVKGRQCSDYNVNKSFYVSLFI